MRCCAGTAVWLGPEVAAPKPAAVLSAATGHAREGWLRLLSLDHPAGPEVSPLLMNLETRETLCEVTYNSNL